MKVSVIMAVFNAAEFLKEAVDSIVNQTMKDWELIAIDDCSTDDSLAILRSYSDPRIKIIENEMNSGPAITRNKGLKLATGEFIAVMDADDVSSSKRFELQINYLLSSPGIDIVGSWANAINNKGDYLFQIQTPTNPNELRTRLLFENSLVHSSVMLRREIVLKYNLFYDEYFMYAQDFELFTRASRFVNLANIPDVLVYYRYSPNHISTRNYEKQSLYGIQIIENHYINLGVEASKVQLEILYSLLYKFKYLKGKERRMLLVLFYTLYLYVHNSEGYSSKMLRKYFVRLYKLACAGKGGRLRYLLTIFDIVPILRFNNYKQSGMTGSFVRFYLVSLIA